MVALIDRLNALIRQQEAERARQIVKRKAEQERLAREEAARAAKPAKTPTQPTLAPKISTAEPDESQSGSAFSSLKGKLRLPLRGEIVGRFGTARVEGSTWKGVFIRAAAGQPVKAVASGRVVFADWMRGFGNLLIVDHGDAYLSIYGNNDSLLKQVGQSVKGGETVATVGNSGGNPESGLYFELRHQGQPIDPMKWASLK